MHHFLALVNLIGLFLFEAIFMADVKVVQDVPAIIEAGQEVRVTVTVEKGTLTGFAKLQIDLPAGLTATSVETKGASFTFADQKAKFIWMALPSQPKFQISYTLKADPAAIGSLTITGRLSYIEDNERRTHELAAATVQISGDTPLALVSEPVEERAAPEPGTVAPLNAVTLDDIVAASGAMPIPSPDRSVIPPTLIPAQQGKGDVRSTRTITPVSPTEMLVEVLVEKGMLRGFGKLQETIPAGFSALEKQSDEAIFTAQGTIVKFVWLNMPGRQQLKVVYKLRSNTAPPGNYVVNGEFGYLLNDETQKAIVGSTAFTLGGDVPVAQEPRKEVPVEVVQAPKTVEQREAVKEQPARTEPVVAEKNPSPRSTSRIPAPENGLVYRVQISAAHREVGKPYFAERHRFNGEFNIERHDGWVKYTTGRFGQYREARDQRNAFISAGHNFPGPFVTAYNNGERITVQEALMIGNQRWVQ